MTNNLIKSLLLLSVAFLLSIYPLTSNAEDIEDKLVGEWKCEKTGESYTFKENGQLIWINQGNVLQSNSEYDLDVIWTIDEDETPMKLDMILKKFGKETDRNPMIG